MKPSEDEIIAHIKDSLATYEEAYVPGSWEKFSKQESKKPAMIIFLTRISSVAAVVILGMMLFWFSTREHKGAPEQAAKISPQNDVITSPKQVESALETNATELIARENTSIYRPNVASVDVAVSPIHNNPSVVVADVPDNDVGAAMESTQNPIARTAPSTVTGEDKEQKPRSIEDFLKNESDRAVQTAAKIKEARGSEDRWEVGVVVSPSFGNTKKINMGYGVSMGYSLTDKFSLSSGFSYNEMAASKSVGQTVAAVSAIAGENKSLESIEQKVTGIDIPLDIKYNISKNVYANVGVSAFAVIDQRQNNNYVQERLVERAYASPAGSKEYNTLIVNEKITEDAPPSEIGKNNYIGFYNFSFGYRQKVAKDKSISIEPFMKVPMKEVTKDNLRLMGTGVKLRFDF